jgi:hypothetical protein
MLYVETPKEWNNEIEVRYGAELYGIFSADRHSSFPMTSCIICLVCFTLGGRHSDEGIREVHERH